jgi:hypothetical protein
MTNPSIINHSGAHNQKSQPKESSRSKKELSPAGAGDARSPDRDDTSDLWLNNHERIIHHNVLISPVFPHDID